ncbi:MAG: DUF4148 domain-containing protein [Pseudomonadota bacterium]
MKTKLIAATVLAFSAMSTVPAFAMSHLYGEAALVVMPAATASALTRAEVQTDYLQARQQGALSVSNEGAFAAAAPTTTSVSRADVRSQAAMSVMPDGRNAH